MILPSAKNPFSARGRAIASFEEAIDRSSVAASRISSDSLQEGRIGIAIRREANGPLVRADSSPRSRPHHCCG